MMDNGQTYLKILAVLNRQYFKSMFNNFSAYAWKGNHKTSFQKILKE